MPRTTAIRIAAAVLAAIIVAFSVFTYLAYSAAFTPTETVIGDLSASRFGDGPRRQGQVPRHPNRQSRRHLVYG